jgi:hypothetical protein
VELLHFKILVDSSGVALKTRVSKISACVDGDWRLIKEEEKIINI